MKSLKKGLFMLLIIASIILLGILVYVIYLDANSSQAKEYLIDKYDFKKTELFSIKYTEFVYEDITDCNSLWFKKCTDNKNLLYEYTFKTKKGEKIVVSEDKEGNYNDNYKEESSEESSNKKDIEDNVSPDDVSDAVIEEAVSEDEN